MTQTAEKDHRQGNVKKEQQLSSADLIHVFERIATTYYTVCNMLNKKLRIHYLHSSRPIDDPPLYIEAQ